MKGCTLRELSWLNQVVALGVIVVFAAGLEMNVGIPPTIIVGGSAIIGRVHALHLSADLIKSRKV